MACFQARFVIARRAPRRGDPAGLLRRGATPLLAMTGLKTHPNARSSQILSRGCAVLQKYGFRSGRDERDETPASCSTQLARIDDDMSHPLSFPRIGNVNATVRRLYNRGIGIFARLILPSDHWLPRLAVT